VGTLENMSGGPVRPYRQQIPTSDTMGTLENMSRGARLREERLKCGWSQQELADLIGVSKPAIHLWEHNGIVPQPINQRKLAEIFKISIEELYSPQGKIVNLAGLGKIQELEKPKYITPQHLPFIGRDEDIQKILDKLKVDKFFAITGTIGVGKSELAYQVVEEAKRTRLFPTVKIIYLHDKSSTEDALAEIHRVIEALPPNSLVVLDNCEHLKRFTEAINRLRREHSQFYILATSRVEMTRSDYPIKSLKPNEAVQLFLKAAEKVGKTPTDNDTPKVEELCSTLLYGLPLALLLAAGLLEPYPFDQVYITAKEEDRLIEAKNYFSDEERHQKTLEVL
jgi:transcriptional regulator with XRE-family HTH domain